MRNNVAFVATLKNIRKIENADKIVACDVTLNNIPVTQVVVGVDTQEDTKVVYFDSNLCINPDVIIAIDKLSPNYGEKDFLSLGNYLGKNGRVRSISLKKTPSDGLAVAVDKFLIWEVANKLVEGFSFDTLGNTEICHKYTIPVKHIANNTPKTKRERKEGSRIVKGMFPEHVDTDNLTRNISKIDPYDVSQISMKAHGSSLRVANTLIYRNLSILEKVAKFFGAKIQDTEYRYTYGSRQVTKEIENIVSDKKQNHFYSGGDLYTSAGKKFFHGKLHEGEQIYAEIVGYTLSGGPIQKIGKYIYNYGCEPNTYDVYVYRITRTSHQNIVTELSIPAYRERCEELGVKPVEQLWYGRLCDKYPDVPVDENWRANFLQKLTDEYLEGIEPSCLVKGTPREGIVLRIESESINVFKHKSKKFLQGESASYDKGEVQDTEEEEAVVN